MCTGLPAGLAALPSAPLLLSTGWLLLLSCPAAGPPPAAPLPALPAPAAAGLSSTAKPAVLDTMMESSHPGSAADGRSGVLLVMLFAAEATAPSACWLFALDKLLLLFTPCWPEPGAVDASTDRLPESTDAAAGCAGLLL